MKKIIYHFEEDGELDVRVDPKIVSDSFLIPWKWLGDFQAFDDDDYDKSKCTMIGECYGRISGSIVNGKIHGTVLFWHYCFNRKGCHHELRNGILISNEKKIIHKNNWVCQMVFETGKLIGKPKKYSVVMKTYRCRRIWRVFFSTIPMSRNSFKCCAQWWGEGDKDSVPVIVEWS